MHLDVNVYKWKQKLFWSQTQITLVYSKNKDLVLLFQYFQGEYWSLQKLSTREETSPNINCADANHFENKMFQRTKTGNSILVSFYI